jgi:tetratricopeptide (TPR) repeat protein
MVDENMLAGLLADGIRFHQAGLLYEAEQSYRRMLSLQPDNCDALHLLGVIAHQMGRHDEAVDLIQRAINANKRAPQFYNNLGSALQELGRLEEAGRAFRRALNLKPDVAETHRNLAKLLERQGRLKEAMTSLKRALALQPDNAESHYDLGHTLASQGSDAEAAACYRRALALRPDYAEAHNNLGIALAHQGHLGEALACYRQALAVKPDYAEALDNLGRGFLAQGRAGEAEQTFSEVLKLRPDFAQAYYDLVRTRKFTPEDAGVIAAIERLLQQTELDDAGKIDSHFALGKIHDDLGRYEQAFSHFATANRLSHQHYKFDREHHAQTVSRLIRMFSTEFFAHNSPSGSASDLPIVIVGMPRSGTTLVEQIVSSHPLVFGAGEVGFWPQQAEAILRHPRLKLSQQAALSIAERYTAYLQSFSPDAKHVTDKLPHNFLHLGLIHAVFPNARIIHCKRNPLDTCLSIYSLKFTGAHAYANDLDDLAFYYEQYERLMAHWRAVLPQHRLLEVQYEELVAEQESVSRRLIDFCGLEWDQSCLDFHRTERTVLTLSNWQVRQPLYRASMERWRNYAPFLGPLARLTGASAGVNPLPAQ